MLDVTMYCTVRRHWSHDRNLHSHSHDNLKSL